MRRVKASGLARGRYACLCPTSVDYEELGRLADADTEIVFFGASHDLDELDFDAVEFADKTIAELDGQYLDGIVISDDPAALVGAYVAEHLGLPAPSPRSIFICQDKLRMRRLQRHAIPEATVPALLYTGDPAARVPLPSFARPDRGYLSCHAALVSTMEELQDLYQQALPFFEVPVHSYNQFARFYGEPEIPPNAMILEPMLTGEQVTVEGYVSHGIPHILGVVDSIMVPGTLSFDYFLLPSRLPESVQARMGNIASRVMLAAGFDSSLFNVEMFWHPDTDGITVIEVNPRMSPPFASLLDNVLGVNSFDIALDLAAGRRPAFSGLGKYTVAASYCVRGWGISRVTSVPGPDQIARLYREVPDSRLRVLCEEGDLCAESQQDRWSYRFAQLNVPARSHAELDRLSQLANSIVPFAGR